MEKTIKINTELLNKQIEILSNKRDDLISYSPNKYGEKGNGLSTDKLKEIELLYDEMKNEIVNLYEKTILYMKGLSLQTDKTDNSISKSMNLGG